MAALYSMYYQLIPHKSTTMGFSVAFECLQSFLHAFINAFAKWLNRNRPNSEIPHFYLFLLFSNELALTCELTQ